MALGTTFSENDIEIHAVGTRIKGTIAENLKWGIEPVMEFGEVGPLTLQAWALHAELSYTLADLPASPTIAIETNHATGDDTGLLGDMRLNTFFNWFPSYHGTFGIMDLFRWSNIHHYKVGCTLHPLEPLKVEVAGHLFYVDHEEDVWYQGHTTIPSPLGGSAMRNRPANPAANERVGQEVDIVVTYDVNERTSVEAGYAHFFDGPLVRNTGPAGGADFFYTMTTFKF
jgi:hypothetical protein